MTTTLGDQDRRFFGHPRGLGYLVFAEAWERFSYYGMLSLLALYMSQQLFLPGHIEAIAGFAAFRGALEAVFGPKTPLALALLITGLYSGGVYVTPIAGGFLADRVLGRTRTVVLGALLMALGHFLMAFEVLFLPALACLLIGVGCFKGNIASQVGELYAIDDPRRADAFQIFLLGINVAVIVSPLICGTLGQKVAWHWGFGAAGVGMLIGLVVYLSGRRWLPPDAPRRPRPDRGAAPATRTRLTADELKTVGILVLLLPVLAVAGVGNQQIFGAYIVWGDANYNLVLLGQTMPATWLLSMDAIISAATIVATVAFWRWWAVRRREPAEITKLAIGALIAAFAPLAPDLRLRAGSADRPQGRAGLGPGVPLHQRHRLRQHLSHRSGALFARRPQVHHRHDHRRLLPEPVWRKHAGGLAGRPARAARRSEVLDPARRPGVRRGPRPLRRGRRLPPSPGAHGVGRRGGRRAPLRATVTADSAPGWRQWR